jgi:serine/threonine protein kinase
MSEFREKRISPNNSILETNHTQEKLFNTNTYKDPCTYSKVSPLPKPDFSSLEKNENNFAYKKKGSYKKPKSNVPESPMKSPNQKFFTPVKLGMKNLFGANANTCRKLNFGENEIGDIDMNIDNNLSNNNFTNFTDTFKIRGKSFLDKLEEEEKLTSSEVSPDEKRNKFKEKTRMSNLFSENFAMDVDDAPANNDLIGFTLKSFTNNYNDREMSDDSDANLSNQTNAKKSETKFEKEFEIIKTLDTGAFGIVYKCRSKIDNKIYAVKKSKKHSSNYEYNIAINFIDQVCCVNSFKKSPFSQFCVSYKEAWMDLDGNNNSQIENHLFISQEFCKYGDLLDYLEKIEESGFKFTEEFYWDLIFEMMCGVNFIHECEFIHFDIKPGNFLIDDNGCVKLGDFGLSRNSKTLKKGEDIFEGDSIYIAPEFFNTGNKIISNKVDVFSLGLSILEILCKVELPQNGKLWKTIRSENFCIPEEFINNSNIKINNKMILLIKNLLLIDLDERPSIISLFQSVEFEELNKRYTKLLCKEYIRIFNPKYFDNTNDNEDEEAFSSILNGKRSNSYKIDF